MTPTVTAERPVEQVRQGKLLLRELILENLMTYKYARIPISPGLNLILGPNGAGKSSILLGLSVGLGQAHTERGRRLSDLIRWGEDIARITLVFDNSPRNGVRPIPEIRTDELVITRYLRDDGEYWHQMNFRQATKLEIYDVLNRFGIDPDNMFIIMHQYMVEEIAALTPQAMLQTIERAVGLTHFRDRIRESREKLTEVASEEKQISALLAEAQSTLETWRGEVEKLQRRDSLRLRITELQIEQAWSEHATSVQELERLRRREASISEKLERLNAKIEAASNTVTELFKKTREQVERLTSHDQAEPAAGLAEELLRTVEDYAGARVKEAILRRNISLLTKLSHSLQASAREAEKECEEALSRATQLGPKPSRIREKGEIAKEMEDTQIALASIGSVVENAVEVYESYKKTYDDIEQKSISVKKNKESVLSEIEETLSLWRREVSKLVDRLSDSFKDKMRSIGADGEVRFVDQEDMEKAGVQIMVSFGGGRLVELNSFTQSGGERSSSIIAFMLSLQSLIQSPLRALDEFDIHMDPRNREIFFDLVEKEANGNPEASYLVVTPGQVPKTVTKAVGIVVQKVSGTSVINVVEKI